MPFDYTRFLLVLAILAVAVALLGGLVWIYSRIIRRTFKQQSRVDEVLNIGSEQQARSSEQQARLDEALNIGSEQQARSSEQQARLETLISRDEDRQQRMDALIAKWENMTTRAENLLNEFESKRSN